MKRISLHILSACFFLVFQDNANSQDLAGMGINKGIKASGGISLSNIVYNTNDSVLRRDPYQAILSGNLNLNIFGYDAPFSFIYSNSQRSYTQPFNRLSFTPTYKWIKAYIGRTSMNFSPYTLSGHSFRGAGLELTPGNWRLSVMGGRLRKAVEYDQLSPTGAQPAYKRMGYGMKLGWEKGPTGILVNFFSAKDDENSIRETGEAFGLHPMRNMAAGISGRTSLFGHFSVEGEYAISLVNSDLRLGSSGDSTGKDISIFSFEPAGARRFDAITAGAGYQSEEGGLMLKYERVAPDYQSFGAYYFNNDLENLTVVPSLRLLEGRFSFSGNLGIQRNNLDQTRESTTRRFVGAGNVNFNVSEKWSLTLNYSNFSTYTNMKPRDDPFFRDDMDTLNFYQVTTQAGGTLNYTFGNKELPGSLLLFTSFQKANEAGSDNKSDFLSANASYSKTIIPDVIISVLYNLNTSESPGLKSVYHGPGITMSRIFKEKKIRTAINSTCNMNRMNGLNESPVLSTGLSVNWSAGNKVNGKHNITSNITWVQRFRSEIRKGRREITATVNYSYAF